MKRTKIIIISAVMLLAVSAFAVPALAAATYNTPAEAAAGVTGKPVEEIISEKVDSGKTYGQIAAEEGKLEEFKEEVLEIKKDRLQDKVDSGRITQEQADEAVSRIEEKQANCDGTGNGSGLCDGTGIGAGNNSGRQKGNGSGQGNGTGRGAGNGLRDGSCVK